MEKTDCGNQALPLGVSYLLAIQQLGNASVSKSFAPQLHYQVIQRGRVFGVCAEPESACFHDDLEAQEPLNIRGLRGTL